MAKQPGKALRTGPACAPFRTHLEYLRSVDPKPSSWAAVQEGFLKAMQAFDDEVIAGRASDGERQNGKGDYFNDVLALVLENAADVALDKRTGVPGLIFPNHNLDVTYPQTGEIVEVLVEAKMIGTPQHPGNAGSQDIVGRAASSDLLKRCKEAGFKTIDLKAAYGMMQSERGIQQQQGMSGDLTSWLRTSKPTSYLVGALRVVSPQDAKAVITMAQNMTNVMDGVGLFLYSPVGYRVDSLSPAKYEPVSVPPTLELRRVMQRIRSDLVDAKNRIAVHGVEVPVREAPSVAVDKAMEQVDEAE